MSWRGRAQLEKVSRVSIGNLGGVDWQPAPTRGRPGAMQPIYVCPVPGQRHRLAIYLWSDGTRILHLEDERGDILWVGRLPARATGRSACPAQAA
jgi:hypothetical protein